MRKTSPIVSGDPSDLQTLLEACAHPVRGRILIALSERPDVTIREVARRLDESPRRVRHHVDVLLKANVVEVTGENTRANVIERRYGAPRIVFEHADGLSGQERVEIARMTVRLLLADMAVAAAAGTFAGREDFQMRIHGEVDDACLDQLARIHWDTYREILATVEAGGERFRRGEAAGTEIVSSLFFFEAPLWGARTPDDAVPGSVKSLAQQHRLAVISPDAPNFRDFTRALEHPVQGRIIPALAERPGVTIGELAGRLKESPRRVRHQVETLLRAGLVDVSWEEKRGRAVERRYEARRLVMEDTRSLSNEERFRLAKAVVRLLLADLAVAAAAGTFAGSDDFQVRIYGEVDYACLKKLARIHLRTCREIWETVDAGSERIRVKGVSGTEIVSSLFFFEAPLWGAREPSRNAP